jgi:hypothetical protein
MMEISLSAYLEMSKKILKNFDFVAHPPARLCAQLRSLMTKNPPSAFFLRNFGPLCTKFTRRRRTATFSQKDSN